MKKGLDLLSILLVDTEDEIQSDFLESLISQKDMNSWCSEDWIVFASYMCNCKNYSRAGLFAHKAKLVLGANTVENLYLNAFCCFKIARYDSAIEVGLIALNLCSYR